MPFKKGDPNAGRPQGSQNKVTRAFKEAVLTAFNQMGGTDALVEWGQANKTQFYQIAARLIPHEVIGPGDKGEHLIKTVVDEHH